MLVDGGAARREKNACLSLPCSVLYLRFPYYSMRIKYGLYGTVLQ